MHAESSSPSPSDAESLPQRQEGFWFSAHEPHLPYPVSHAQAGPTEAADLVALTQVEGAIQAGILGKALAYRGMSMCRHCGGMNGHISFHAENWEWPQGLAHYVQEHHVALSDAFRAWVYDVARRPEVAAVPARVIQVVTPRAEFVPSPPEKTPGRTEPLSTAPLPAAVQRRPGTAPTVVFPGEAPLAAPPRRWRP